MSKPVHPVPESKVVGSTPADKKSPDRQTKIAELKARIQTGQYKLDTQELAKHILNSGILGHE